MTRSLILTSTFFAIGLLLTACVTLNLLLRLIDTPTPAAGNLAVAAGSSTVGPETNGPLTTSRQIPMYTLSVVSRTLSNDPAPVEHRVGEFKAGALATKKYPGHPQEAVRETEIPWASLALLASFSQKK